MQYISKIYYINLDKRTDRRAQIEGELEHMGLEGERFPAIALEHAPGVGCSRSHLEVLKLARAAGYENVLIFEDDFEWIVSKEVLETQLKAFFEANIPYDVLMLSYYAPKTEAYNQTVSYAREAQTASGYIVHRRFYDTLISLYEWSVPQLIKTGEHWHYMNDQAWKRLQPGSEWFIFNTRLGKQRPGYSDLGCRYVDNGV
jgi:glycosyl transferase family 25